MKVFVLSGNIGAGKSSVGEAAAAVVGALFVPEPVELWQSTGGLGMAQASSSIFQPFALASRVFGFRKAIADYESVHNEKPLIVIVERWLEDDLSFAKINLKAYDFAKYSELWKATRAMNMFTYTTIRIQAPLDMCLDRIGRRGREEEHDVTRLYLCALESVLPNADYAVHNVHLDSAVTEVVSIILKG